MRCILRGVATIAVAAMALPARISNASDSAIESILDEREASANQITDAAYVLGQTEGSTGPETLAIRVAEIQGMNESDLKLELRSLYSTSKDVIEKQMYPIGSLEAMQDLLNTLGSVDDEQRDINQFMNRFAYLVAKVIDRYNDFFTVKVSLGDPKISGEDYKREVAKLPMLAAEWTAANELLVGFLTLGANDLKDKWDQSATTDKRLRELLEFIEKLADVYKAQQRLFRMGFALAQLRYMEYPDHQADLTALMEDPRQKQALVDFEDALENIKEKTHLARKAANSSVQDGILTAEYLTLLPFPHDKQRELDDLPKDEM